MMKQIFHSAERVKSVIKKVYHEYDGTTSNSPLNFFPFTGICKTYESVFAIAIPTRSPVKDPGPGFTSIESISVRESLCSFKTSTIKGSNTCDEYATEFAT